MYGQKLALKKYNVANLLVVVLGTRSNFIIKCNMHTAPEISLKYKIVTSLLKNSIFMSISEMTEKKIRCGWNVNAF